MSCNIVGNLYENFELPLAFLLFFRQPVGIGSLFGNILVIHDTCLPSLQPRLLLIYDHSLCLQSPQRSLLQCWSYSPLSHFTGNLFPFLSNFGRTGGAFHRRGDHVCVFGVILHSYSSPVTSGIQLSSPANLLKSESHVALVSRQFVEDVKLTGVLTSFLFVVNKNNSPTSCNFGAKILCNSGCQCTKY